ncbi:ABC transporter ATP-binding protein [Nosocomiicoccus sp. HMSC059G07]|uniref:ABC transporter ATP-binding protein n=1 Tax=Nosocomiicoccus sp. HMSC059G07 TaxID=1739531 RepID=UPI0008A3824A|nr:ABC transporter ATP-binding protein [Nosocomiicoccus sp. HMSC059G07]OFO54075.1 peptide ABC transporter ATP-binding protein [Nosocomiicoccus sp. HMSC059G07]
MLKFEEVSKEFKDGKEIIEAVQPVSLTLNKGELVAIIGPSGSGKSTFLTMAGALQKPSKGIISIDDEKITNLNDKELAKLRLQKIGFILQTSNLVDFLTVSQQFELLKKYKKDVISDEKLDQLLKRLDLDKTKNQLPSEISGGQRQRVAIAKALYTDPAIILADEPTASLDTNNALEVMEILRELTKEYDKITIIVTHDNRLIQYSDRVLEMIDGKLTETKQ